MEPPGRSATSSREEMPGTVLSRRRGCLRQGQHGHFHYVITWWKCYHLFGLEDTKTRALESLESESRAKRYKGFGGRGYFAKKLFTNRPLAEITIGACGGIRFPEGETYFRPCASTYPRGQRRAGLWSLTSGARVEFISPADGWVRALTSLSLPLPPSSSSCRAETERPRRCSSGRFHPSPEMLRSLPERGTGVAPLCP